MTLTLLSTRHTESRTRGRSLHLMYVSAAVAILLSGASGSVLAAKDWTSAGQITELNQQPPVGVGASQVFVTITGVTYNPTDPSTCTVRNGFYFSVTDDRTKRLFATLLAAQMSSRPVRVWATDNCHPWGHAELDGVVLN